MRMLLGQNPGPISPDDLTTAYPWPEQGRWLRGLMLMTTDGASVGPDGRSGSISGQIDRDVMAAIRGFCDAIVIGAATMRAERYRPQRPDATHVAARRAQGLADAPVMVLVSGSLDLPWQEDLFARSTMRPIVVTGSGSAPAAREVAARHADVVVLDSDRVEPLALVDTLAARGLRRIICEGGPHLLEQIAEAGLLDELDLTISPLIAGGGRIGSAAPGSAVRSLQLAQLIEADGFLFTRYLSYPDPRSPGSSPDLREEPTA